MNARKPWLLFLPLLFLAGLAVTWSIVSQSPTPSPEPSPKPTLAYPESSVPKAGIFQGALAFPPSERRAGFAALKVELASLPAEEALALARDFLARGENSSTGMSFEIGEGGELTGWPTLRTFVLDALRRIDPAAAAEISRDLLAAPTTADEWALALRNVASGPDDAPDFLHQKTLELIENPTWQAAPSVGFLNAFDVLVHLGSAESTPILSGFLQNQARPDLAHASFLTLNGLIQKAPAETLAQLATDRDLHQARPAMVAQQFARADLTDQAQREVLKSWLIDPTRTPAELIAFTQSFPNHNHLASKNLLTTATPPSSGTIKEKSEVARYILAAWQEDPTFARISPHLHAVISRL